MWLGAFVLCGGAPFGSVVAEGMQYGVSPSSYMFDGGIGAFPRDDTGGLRAVPTCGSVITAKPSAVCCWGRLHSASRPRLNETKKQNLP